MLEVLLIIIAVGAVAFFWVIVGARRRHAELESQSRQKLGELRMEHDERVGRLKRKFDDVEAHGHLDFAADLLPALDALGQALDQSRRVDDVAALREGLEMVDRELVAVLGKHGIEVINPEPGDGFDPMVHEAVAIEEADALEPGCVAACFRPGYVHQDRCLRSASVAVTRRASASEANDEDPIDEDPIDEDVQADAVELDDVSPETVDDDDAAPSEPDSSSRL